MGTPWWLQVSSVYKKTAPWCELSIPLRGRLLLQVPVVGPMQAHLAHPLRVVPHLAVRVPNPQTRPQPKRPKKAKAKARCPL